MPTAAKDWTPVGAPEIAVRLGVERDTIYKWQQRDLLPAMRWRVCGGPAWAWWEIEEWARETGRLTARGTRTRRTR